jgi:uncharacterized protein
MSYAYRFLGSLILIIPFGAVAASFDCSKAKSKIEIMICADANLSKLDEELNSTYKRVLASSSVRADIVNWQRDWLKNELKYCTEISCLQKAFSSRLMLLTRIAPKGSPEAAWNGTYIRHYKNKVDTNSSTVTLIGLNNDEVYVLGSSLWYGVNAKIGQVNDGEIDGIGKVTKGQISFDLDGCRGEISMKGKILQIDKELGCGGFNVTFNGSYVRK